MPNISYKHGSFFFFFGYFIFLFSPKKKKTKVTFILYFKKNKVYVNNGDRVRMGQKLAKANNSGKSTGTHLHLGALIDGVATPINCINWDKGKVEPTCFSYYSEADNRRSTDRVP